MLWYLGCLHWALVTQIIKEVFEQTKNGESDEATFTKKVEWY